MVLGRSPPNHKIHFLKTLVMIMIKWFTIQYRSNHHRCSIKIGVLKYFAIVIGKHLSLSLFLIKLQAFKPATLLKRDSNTRPATLLKGDPNPGVFCEYCEIFKNTYFKKHLQTAASDKRYVEKCFLSHVLILIMTSQPLRLMKLIRVLKVKYPWTKKDFSWKLKNLKWCLNASERLYFQ